VLKADLFRKAMNAGLYRDFHWCVPAFSIINEKEDAWKEDPYLYRIVQHHTGFFFVNEQKELELIEDAVVDEIIYRFEERLKITPEDTPNCQAPVETSYGNLLTNWCFLIYPFGKKISYMSGYIKPGQITDIIAPKFTEDPLGGDVEKKPDLFYVSEYLKLSDAVDYMRTFSYLSVQAATPKLLVPPPGIDVFKKQLLEKYDGKLDDLATIADIEKQLLEYDAAFLKGDPGEKFLIGKKSRAIVRKKKFLMHGAETGLEDNAVKGVLIQNSLYEGWDYTKFPDMINSLRAGSFNRGAQTQLGGVSVKWLLRASANLKIAGKDCGSTMGVVYDIVQSNASQLVGRTVLDNGKNVHVDDESHAGAYLGRSILVRSPMYCRYKFTDFCETCLGDKLSISPTGLSVSVSDCGSVFLGIYMSAAHAKQLVTQELILEEIMS
jgi:hypothetical protein